MKLVKSLLLGSAAGLCAVAGAQAADLPMRKAAPVEYVRVCTAYGAGFFYIPGTDTCLRVGGRVRFDYHFTSQNSRSTSQSGFIGLGRLNIDARTQTPYGTLRAFVRFDIASRNGVGIVNSSTQTRYANSFRGDGPDTASQAQKFVNVDKAFVQFAGITAGRAQSFYDFYAGDLEFMGAGVYSQANTNLLAYTATFGGGFSATVSMEDPTFRRQPVFFQGTLGVSAAAAAGGVPAAQVGGSAFLAGSVPVAFVPTAFNAAGTPTAAIALDTAQRLYLPDFVAALRYDAAWGSAQVSGAVHEIKTGAFTGGSFAVNGGAGVAAFTPRIPEAEYGFAFQGGVKVNLPMLAPGDQLWLQGAYGEGAMQYTGVNGPGGSEGNTAGTTNRFTINTNDAVLDVGGNLRKTQSFSVTAAALHYWTPEIRQAVFGTYGNVNYDGRLRVSNFGPAGLQGTGGAGAGAVTAVNPFNSTLMDWEVFYGGSNLIWSPVRDLDIGVEVVYQRHWLPNRVADANKGGAAAIGGTTVTGTGRTTSVDDTILARFRVQRDF